MILKISILVATSIAAVAVSHIGIGSSTSTKRNTRNKPSENVNSSYRQEQEQVEGEEDDKIADSNISIEDKQKEEDGMKQNMKIYETIEFPLQVNKLNNAIETELLQDLVKEVEQRRVILDGKLLELYGLEEEQSYIVQLRKHLKAKTEQANNLNIKIISLQADINEFLEQIESNWLAAKQFDMENKKIMEMQAKMGSNANKLKGQLKVLEERVCGIQMKEIYAKNAMVEKQLKALKDAGLEVVEMKRRNRKLQLEKRDLRVELAAAEARVAALSNMTESKIVAMMEEEMLCLRQANEDLSNQIERLQKNRLDMVEELVYQRWLNACLRFEIQNHQTPSRTNQTLPDIDKISNNESIEKSKQLMSCLSFDSVDSPIFSPDTGSDEIKSTTTTFDSSSSIQRSICKKSSLFDKISKWGKSKDKLSHILSPSSSSTGKTMSKTRLIRRFSMSMVPSHASMSGENGKSEITTEFSRRPSSPRKRRVSFSNSVKTFPSTFQYMQRPGEETSAENSYRCSSVVGENRNSIPDELGEREKPKSLVQELVKEKTGQKSDVENEVAHIEELNSGKPVVLGNDTKAESIRVDLVIISFFFFILIILAYCILLTAGIYKA